MNEPAALLDRLDAIGASLAGDSGALALLGLGSVGQELDRLDAFSDLDFFAIVDADRKAGYLADLRWLERAHPVAFAFRNTVDGHKVLFADGIFCEFAVFAPDELAGIGFVQPRLVWSSPRFDPRLAEPVQPVPARSTPPEDLAAEALTNLYVGLLREHRGERLAAFRMIQGHALDRLLELVDHVEMAVEGSVDPYAIERRFELRHPALADSLATMAPGYDQNRAAARAILSGLERFASVDPALGAEVLRLAEHP